jgi:hypothetical protein
MDDYNRRFGCEPRSPHDVHRPVRREEDLEQIFTWQEDRKLTKNLTLHYKSVTYLVEPGPHTLPLAGRRCRVYEPEEGPIEIRSQGELLPYRTLFDKKPHVRQTAIVENKRLAAVLTQIREGQRARDQQRLAGHRLSQREKERIRKAQERADTL